MLPEEETRRRGDCECAMWKIAIKLWKCTLNYAPDMGSECEGGTKREGEGRAISWVETDWQKSSVKSFAYVLCSVQALMTAEGAAQWRRKRGELDGNLSSSKGQFNWQFRLKSGSFFIVINIYKLYELNNLYELSIICRISQLECLSDKEINFVHGKLTHVESLLSTPLGDYAHVWLAKRQTLRI